MFLETGSSNISAVDWDISPKFGMQVDFDLSDERNREKNERGCRIAMPWRPSWKGYDVITMSRMVQFWQNSTGRCRVICLPKLLDMHFEDAQTGPVHAPKTAILMKKTWQFTTFYKDDGSKIAELKQKIPQKMILVRSTVTFRNVSITSSSRDFVGGPRAGINKSKMVDGHHHGNVISRRISASFLRICTKFGLLLCIGHTWVNGAQSCIRWISKMADGILKT